MNGVRKRGRGGMSARGQASSGTCSAPSVPSATSVQSLFEIKIPGKAGISVPVLKEKW